jgi:hypothetical protein
MGIQHYQYPNPFHSTRAQFVAQCQRDALKEKICDERNIKLVIIPHTIQRDDLEQFLRTELQHELAMQRQQEATRLETEEDVLVAFARIDI